MLRGVDGRALLLSFLFAACGAPGTPPRALEWTGPVVPSFAADSPGDFYRYAPSIVQTDAGTRYAFTCGNTASGEIKDHLLARRAVRGSDGSWRWSPETVALSPSDPVREACTGFDCFHVCDPEYVEGVFVYRGVTYTSALLYTGNDVDASAHNSIGLALALSPDGPWVRTAQPLVAYEAECDASAPPGWGVGQPSATSVDGRGRLLLFARVQCGRTGQAVRWDADLSRLDDAAPPALGAPLVLPLAGLTTGAPTSGAPDPHLNDASYVYDAARDVFYVVRSQHPLPLDAPSNITTQVQVDVAPGALVRTGLGAWTPLGDIAPSDDGGNTWVTGFARNHNAGIVRTPRGAPVEGSALEIAYTASIAGSSSSLARMDRIANVRGALRE